MNTSWEHRGYALTISLQEKKILVVGSGNVAKRKIEGLLSTGAKITIIAPEVPCFTGDFMQITRNFQASDCDGMDLVFAATNRVEVNRLVAESAQKRGIPVNIADDPKGSTFHVPAVLRRGPITIAVSTGGKSPVLAQIIRDELSKAITDDWSELATNFETLRNVILNDNSLSITKREEIWSELKSLASTTLRQPDGIQLLAEQIRKILSEQSTIDQ